MRPTFIKLGSIFLGLALLFSVFAPSITRSQTQTREELLALIQVLIARVAELQAQIAARTSTPTYGYNFTRDLTLGSTGQDVTALQQFLVNKGFMTTPSGYGTFGPATQNALASYQRARRITPVAGFFGPTTRAIVTQESKSIAFNFGGGGGTSISYSPTYGLGGSGNAPIVPRRTGGGGGGGGGSRSSSNNNNNPGTQTPPGQCDDGQDNDNDGLTDFPIDPGCTSVNSQEGSNPNTHVTYAFKHFVNDDNDSNSAAYNRCTGSGTTYVCNPISNYYNVIYPWPLIWWHGNSMNPYMAKAYLDMYPEGARGMFSWVMDSANDSQENFFRDADNCVDTNGNTITYTWTGIRSTVVNNNGDRVNAGGQVPYRCPWMDDWLATVEPRWDDFFRDFESIGGDVDVLTMDNEYVSAISTVDAAKAASMIANPKYNQVNTNFSTNEIARGPMQSKMQGLSSYMSDFSTCNTTCFHHIENFLYDWYSSYLDKGTYQPFKEYFPDAAFTNFAYTAYNFDQYHAPLFGYVDSCLSGAYCSDMNIVGNYQQPGMLYGMGVQRANLLRDGIHPYVQSNFNKIKEEIHFLKVSRLSDPDSGMAPLYAGSRYTSSGPAGFYAEDIFHALAVGSDFLNMWNDPPRVIAEEEKLSLAMKEFDDIAGFENKETLMFEDSYLNNRLTQADKSAWNDDYILTGIKSGGRIVWRFTPETGHTVEIPTVASTLISTAPPTFRTAQVTISFPQGVIYTAPNSQSNLGYWIIQPIDAPRPIITESDINAPPIASFSVASLNVQSANLVLFDSGGSLDPDGATIVRAYDFNGDGIFGPNNRGDNVRLIDGSECPMNECGPFFGPHWFSYLYLEGGTHTVTLRVTDEDGVSTQVTETFTIPTQICNGPFYECYLTLSTAEDTGSNLAQAETAITDGIISFWRGTASAVFGFFSSLVSFFIP